MQYRSNKGFTVGAQLGILIGLTGAGMVAVSLLQMAAAPFLIPPGTPAELINVEMMEALKDPAHIGFARFLQAAGTFFLFFLPAIIYSGLTNGRNRLWLGFSRHVAVLQFVLGFGLILAANLGASSLEEISKSILVHFPALDKIALDLENAYNESVKVIGLIRTWPELLISIVIMAFLPALFEEAFFRGALQQLLYKWWKSPVLPILISSFVFSLVHFSIFLFLSRFLLGLSLGVMFYLTRNIWISIVAHFMNNAIAVLQLYSMSPSVKEPETDMFSGFGFWFFPVALFAMFLLSRFLYRVSSKNKERILEEERLATV